MIPRSPRAAIAFAAALLLFFCRCASTALGDGSAAGDSWLSVTGPDSAYIAYLPAAPVPFRTATWTPLGRFVTSGFELERAHDGCNLTTTSLPAVLRWLGGADIVYERSRSSFLADNEARATASAAVERAGNRGSVLEWANDEEHGRTEFFLRADRLHIFNCFADLGAAMDLSDNFFARLALRPPDAAPPTPGP